MLRYLFLGILVFAADPFTEALSEPLLSQSDRGYAFIEALQKQYCVNKPNPSHNCQYDPVKCRATYSKLWLELSGQPANEEIINKACNQVSSKFEIPGVYDLLAGLYGDVKQVAPAVGLPTIEMLRFGSLPIRAVNARAFPPDPSLGQFVIFNIRFFEFASELAKIAMLPIPVKERDSIISFDVSDEGFDAATRQNSELSFLFINRILSFLEVEGAKPALPPKNIQPLLAKYQQGIELFAMAHEYSHIALSHFGPTALVEGDDVSAQALGMSGAKGNWAQELEADYYAAKLLQTLTLRRMGASEASMFDYVLPLTPSFYFHASQVLAEAREILFGELAASEPSNHERQLLTIALDCVRNAACKLSNAIGQSGISLDGHPHPVIRKEFMRAMLVKTPINETDEAMQQLASRIDKNIDRFWIELKASLAQPEALPMLEAIRTAKQNRFN